MFDNVNRELFPIKAHYFLFNGATGPIVPFLPTIAKQLGFSGFLVGTIYTVLPISGLIAKPLFGSLADKYKLHKTFFLIFQAILTISFFCIHFIPPFEKNANVILTCDKGLTFLEVCSANGFSQTVKNEIIHANYNTNTTCRLDCEATDYQELCTDWHAKEFCGLNMTDTSPHRRFAVNVTLHITEMLYKRCEYLRITDVEFSDGIVSSPKCPSQLRPSCIATCHDTVINHMLQEVDDSAQLKSQQKRSRTSTYQFHLFLWATVVSWVGMAVVVSIADAICFNLLGNERRKDYGKQKMWGSIGFGMFCIGAGYLVDIFSGNQTEKDYSCIFYIMLITMICDVIASFTLKMRNPECTEDGSPMLWEVLSLAKDSKVLVFGWWCIGAGICTGVVWNFLFWYTEDIASASQAVWLKTLQGLLTGVQCFLGELPFNFASGAVLKKLGHINVMSLVLLVYAVRFMAYSTVKNLWIFLLLELLHGPSLGLCWPTMVSYGDKVTPAGTRATIQGLIGAIFEGIGVATGSFICGWLIDAYGGVVTFRAFSVGALLWLAAFWIMQLLLRKAKAYPIQRGHNHLANYANPDDAILMTMSQELQTY